MLFASSRFKVGRRRIRIELPVDHGHRHARALAVRPRLVDAREVARAGRLVLLRAQRERVHVDTRRRRAAVVLEGLHLVEVRALTLREAVLTVELELGNLNRVLTVAADTRIEEELGEEEPTLLTA